MLVRFKHTACGYQEGDLLDLEVEKARRCVEQGLAEFTEIENQRVYLKNNPQAKNVTDELNKMVGESPENKSVEKPAEQPKKRVGRPRKKP